jgi:phosphoribosylanthranilate isomerase
MNIRNLLTLDYVQLHGHESEGYIKECMAVTKIIRAIGVENEDDMKRVADLDYCHFLLFDKKSPAFGGTGVKFDWKLLESYHGEKPFIIAGGISEDDVEQILAIQHPKFSGIDINSKFETTPGIKDTNKIKSFIKALKN